ncbi:MAG: glycosyltransferase family 39 protein [Planctomycetota bacterium]|nr:glycosyltransferase family 39 protein [Planctomycetota bacterium]
MRRPRATLRARVLLAPLLVLAAVWLTAAGQGDFRVDSQLYAAVGLHGWREGTLFPLMAGDTAYMNKPPVALWIHGLVLHVLGVSLWSARLPALAAALGCVALTYELARRGSGRRVGLVAALVLALTLEFFRHTWAITLDLWVTLFVLAAGLPVARALGRERHSGERGAGLAADAGFVVGVGVPLGLALLTKPVAPLLAAPVFAAALVMAGRRREALLVAAGAALAMAVATPWHVAMEMAYPGVFWGHYFGKQGLERGTGESFGGDPAWFYAELLGSTYWPFLPALVVGGAWVVRERRAERGGLLALVWCGVWLAALSMFAGKSARYALVVYPFAAWLSALGLVHGPRWMSGAARRILVRWVAPVVVMAALVMSAVGVRVLAPPSAHWPALFEELARRNEPLWTSPGMVWSGARVYLATGAWPRTAAAREEAGAGRAGAGADAGPGAGALMLLSEGSGYGPRAGDEVVWRSGRLMLVRTVSAWDGAYARPGAGAGAGEAAGAAERRQ